MKKILPQEHQQQISNLLFTKGPQSLLRQEWQASSESEQEAVAVRLKSSEHQDQIYIDHLHCKKKVTIK